MDDAVTKFTCFEKYLCGQTGQSLTNNVRDMALLELAFQCIDAVALAFTVADEGGLKKNSDLYGLFTLLVSVPTLAVLLWYVLRRHPDAHFLRRFNVWCVLILVLYALGVADDVIWVASASRKRTWSRTLTLIVDIFSLALFGNIVYFNVQLLRRIQQSEAVDEQPYVEVDGDAAYEGEGKQRTSSTSTYTERSPLARGVGGGEVPGSQEKEGAGPVVKQPEYSV